MCRQDAFPLFLVSLSPYILLVTYISKLIWNYEASFSWFLLHVRCKANSYTDNLMYDQLLKIAANYYIYLLINNFIDKRFDSYTCMKGLIFRENILGAWNTVQQGKYRKWVYSKLLYVRFTFTCSFVKTRKTPITVHTMLNLHRNPTRTE